MPNVDLTRRTLLIASTALLAGSPLAALGAPLRTFDVLILGGGPAGLTAALYLGRARRQVLVVDRGSPRHAVSDAVHNLISRDGIPPAALRAEAWAQMAAYPSVQRRDAEVVSLEEAGEGWVATLADGEPIAARAALLATGVIDEHPDIPGYRERWGHAIFHCPFCHGWEVQDQPLAVLAPPDAAAHLGPMLKGWSSDVMVLTHGAVPSGEAAAALAHHGLPVYTTPIARLEGPGRELRQVLLQDGRALERRALFVFTPQRQVPLVASLGLRTTPDGYLAVDPMQATSRPRLWAAGDVTSRFQQVVEACAQGARAAGMITKTLLGV